MGEVYRADDLTLGQSVALKFLPADLAENGDRRGRFLTEVRVARQVSHPNVCRVYDIGDVEGRTFLTMEFVDGEDLSSLLRRIGRLPQEKAIEIARQMCAGLAALHDRGVVHRDLKPANIMIDGRGRVRITDFGLAGGADQIDGEEVRAGTPAYMAPEQLGGVRVDAKSDLYSLGLILYEVFTGKRAFEAQSVAELARLQQSGTPTSVSQWVPDVEPAVERVIARCLEADASRRPPSALAVAASLPGGDPLAEALAAGEVPSMELVAAAGKRGGVRPVRGVLGVLAAAAAVALTAWAAPREDLHAIDPMTKPPVVLADRAREILASVGMDAPLRDTAGGFRTRSELLRWISTTSDDVDRWDRLARFPFQAVTYWYRQSPEPLVPIGLTARVTRSDPAPIEPGMVQVELDTSGRLVTLEAVPPRRDDALAPREVDWKVLLTAAGVDSLELTSVEPEWVPRSHADSRAAWTAPIEDTGDVLRVEAASLHGSPVFFSVVGPWTEDDARAAAPESVLDRIVKVFLLLSIVAVLAVGIFFAVRNVRLGRGDRRGAQRFSLWLMVTMLAIAMMTSSHPGSLNDEINLFLTGCAWALFSAALLFAFYLAVEPVVRKTWPHHLVSWSRVLTNRVRDPLVGRDILLGGVFLFLWVLVDMLRMAPTWMGRPVPEVFAVNFLVFLGPAGAIVGVLASAVNGVFNGVFLVLAFLILRILCRRQEVMLGVFCLILALVYYGTAPEGYRALATVRGALLAAVWLFALFRFGFLAFLVGHVLHGLVASYPLTFDGSQWYSGTSVVAVVAILSLVGYGLSTALTGKSEFRGDVGSDSRA